MLLRLRRQVLSPEKRLDKLTENDCPPGHAIIAFNTDGTARCRLKVSDEVPLRHLGYIEHDAEDMDASHSCGDMLILRGEKGTIVEMQPINCAVMGRTGSGPDEGPGYEVVASSELVAFSGGPEQPVTCGPCSRFNPYDPERRLQKASRPLEWRAVHSYPAVTDMLSAVGSLSYNWYRGQLSPPNQNTCTSYFRDAEPKWGHLTNPHGYGLDATSGPGGGYSIWSGFAFQMYDPLFGQIVAANTDDTGALAHHTVDICNGGRVQ